MIILPEFERIAFSIGPVKVHWYGLMYLLGFVGGWWLGRVQAARLDSGWTRQQVGDLLVYVAFGVIVGGRLGYMLFYTGGGSDLQIWQVWKGGMSFHGGLLGVMTAMWLFGRFHKRSFFQVADFVAPLTCVGLGAGRIGNFINGELWGKIADPSLPWAMVFADPRAGAVPRHPSQLYEALLEGVIMLLILWWFAKRKPPTMAVSALFLILYGAFRILVEFVREPDAHIGYLASDWFTMGMALSLPMIAFGGVLMWWAYHRRSVVQEQ